jgi:hypothetical protein
MKNLHIIPTDKPSRLFLNKVNNKLLLDSDTYCDLIKRLPSSNYQNLYITNSEEIKEGDYYYNERLNQVYQAIRKLGYNTVDREFKVILTTDLRLAPDVQKIDDEFLEWFVKNPSCEEVETFVDTMGCSLENCNGNHCVNYKIIIPKEELKQELNLNCFDCNKSLQDCTCIENTINMTDPLEQAAKEYAERHLDVSGNLGKYLVKAVFQDGVKWEQEQDKNKYSEEEVKKIAFDFYYDISHQMGVAENLISENVTNVDVWFKQFKKKI